MSEAKAAPGGGGGGGGVEAASCPAGKAHEGIDRVGLSRPFNVRGFNA